MKRRRARTRGPKEAKKRGWKEDEMLGEGWRRDRGVAGERERKGNRA